MDIEFKKLHGSSHLVAEIGEWLETNMPNPPLPEKQAWTIGYSIDGRVGIHIDDDQYATLFLLAFSNGF